MQQEQFDFLPPGSKRVRDALRRDAIDLVLATDMKQVCGGCEGCEGCGVRSWCVGYSAARVCLCVEGVGCWSGQRAQGTRFFHPNANTSPLLIPISLHFHPRSRAIHAAERFTLAQNLNYNLYLHKHLVTLPHFLSSGAPWLITRSCDCPGTFPLLTQPQPPHLDLSVAPRDLPCLPSATPVGRSPPPPPPLGAPCLPPPPATAATAASPRPPRSGGSLRHPWRRHCCHRRLHLRPRRPGFPAAVGPLPR